MEGGTRSARRLLDSAIAGDEAARRELAEVWPEICGACCISPELREQLADLREPLGELEEEIEGAGWLAVAIAVPHEAPFVAIEPGTGLGIKGAMSGLADNFQLHMLLMDDFPGAIKGGIFRRRRRISEAAAAVARGTGAQETTEHVSGAWNPYVYLAFRDGKLPDKGDWESRHLWIWNEGAPADIPEVNGHKVILLGPPSYERGWEAVRVFPDLPATLDARPMSDDEVSTWLDHIQAAAARFFAEDDA